MHWKVSVSNLIVKLLVKPPHFITASIPFGDETPKLSRGEQALLDETNNTLSAMTVKKDSPLNQSNFFCWCFETLILRYVEKFPFGERWSYLIISCTDFYKLIYKSYSQTGSCSSVKKKLL